MPKTTTSKKQGSKKTSPPKAGTRGLRAWQWAAAAAAQEAADGGAENLQEGGYEGAIARQYLKRVQGTFEHPKRPTWRTVARALWDHLEVDCVEDWTEEGRYDLSPYQLRIVRDENHPLYDVRGHETTDPNPKEFGALVEGVEAVGWVMQTVLFTEERGSALVVDGRRRVRAARAVNLRRLSAASERISDPRAEAPQLIETIPGVCLLDKRRILQAKNGSNYLRSTEDVLRQLAGIQQLEAVMPLVAIAAMLGVTTQTLANLRSLAELSATARDALRAGKITLSLAYRLARELPERQDAALAATTTAPPKTRARAIEAFLTGESPDDEVRSIGRRDIKSLARKVLDNHDPELAPLRALFCLLRGEQGAEKLLPPKWRQCLGLAEEVNEKSGASPRSEPADRRQTVIDDGVPHGMRVECPQCKALPTEYCLGDGPDDVEQWGEQDGTRIHQARIDASGIRGRRPQRMPVLPPLRKEERKGKRGDLTEAQS